MAKLSSFWCRLLLFLALLCVSPKVLARDIHYTDHTTLVKSPTFDKPWTEIKFMFFDEDGKGNDSFFKGPAALTIDGAWTVVPFKEIACEETNGDDGAKSKDNPGRWYDKHIYTLNGTTYTIRLYNAYRESNGEHYVTVYISPDKIRPGEKHTFGIMGSWRPDRKPSIGLHKTFEVTMPTGISNYLVNQSYSRPIKHTSFDKCIFPVNVNSEYGPTTFATNGEAVDSYDDLNDMKFTDPATMASSATVAKGQTEGWVELGVKEIALVEKFIPVQWSYYAGAKKNYIGGTYVYDWTMGCLPGYPRSLDLSTEQNQWKKEITVKWGSSGGAYFYVKSYGKWAVTRVEKKNSAVVRTPVATVDFTGNGNLSVVDDKSLQYDTDYEYEVSFIPTGMTEDNTATKILTSTVKARLVRDVPITITKIDEGENDLTVYWNAPQLGGNNKFQYKVYRAEGNSQNDGTTSSPSYSWEEVGKIDVSNFKQTEYSFKDTKNLKSCTQYFYKVELVVEAWNDKTFDSGEKQLKSYRIKGKSSVTSLEASKGDYTGVVKLSWKAEQKGTTSTKYVLSRRIIGGTQWSQVYAVDGTSQSYYYEDNTALAGNYYQYRVRSYVQCDNDQFTSGEELCDGFCRSTGTLSGRISYDQGTAVAGVKVVLTKSDGQKDTEQFYTLQTSGAGSGVRQTFSDEEKDKFARAYTAQLLVSPASQIDMTDGNAVIFSLGDRHRLSLGTKTGSRYPLFLETGSTSANTGLWLKESCFTSVTLSCDSLSGFRVTLIDDNDSIRTYTNAAGNLAASVDAVCFGGTASENDQKSCFAGYIDEMRLFSGKALTEEEIKENYNHPLSGVEDGLFIYWPVDEGIEDQLTAYDYSKTNGVANAHHGNIKLCKVSGTLPPANMLSLFAVTDSQGNYTLRGVPFNGSGTTYTITPQLGTHSFSPIYSSRYVSASSLVYSGVDFSDQSSFPVSGKVYYANTTIPVEGCTVYVDGKAASNNGKLAQTSSDGTFSVSVPIGRHYIELSKEGHVFVGNGRYPEDPEGIGTTFLCEQPISNLQFNDSTLVNFTGRIAGGLHEMKKNVGFGLSNNNIGQTLITLECLDTNNGQAIFNAVTVKDNGIYKVEENKNRLDVTSQTLLISSESYRGAANYSSFAYIKTDPKTGEFSAMLPPLRYALQEVKFAGNNTDNPFNGENLIKQNYSIDLSDPLHEETDTVSVDGELKVYRYNKAFNYAWHTEPVFNVTQTDNNIGAFGIRTYNVYDAQGNFDATVYEETMDPQTNISTAKYNYGYPLFNALDKYTFKLEAYEEYTNYDKKDDDGKYVYEKVPLDSTTVLISNALSADQVVYDDSVDEDEEGVKTSQIQLDDKGTFTYTWKAGSPNTTSPFTKAIQFYYEVDGVSKKWRENGLEAVILGSKPTGNNFVTRGPNVLEMILRDPPGSASSASWTKGTTVNHIKTRGTVYSSQTNTTAVANLGWCITIATGAVGWMTEARSETKHDQEAGMIVTTEGENATSWTRSITTERTISTSSDPAYVGAQDDVFVGSSTNLVFGDANEVTLLRDGTGQDKAKLDCHTITITGLDYDTEFMYSANYIENTLLPNLEKVRNSLLITLPAESVDSYVNTTDKPVYVTALEPTDERFGSDNDDADVWSEEEGLCPQPSSVGPSYRMVMPQGVDSTKKFVDEVSDMNNAIKNWYLHLKTNEQQKVLANEQASKYRTNNFSFDSGSSLTMSQTVDSTYTKSSEQTTMGIVHVLLSTGMIVNGFGFEAILEDNSGGGTHKYDEESTTQSSNFTYTLAEDGNGDALSVDVYQYDNWGPIFRTMAGQTSAPYEGEVRTSYYKPGEKVIMEATQQIEVPEIMVDNLKWSKVSNVPTGGAANFTLQLRNNSETQEDVYFRLISNDENNANGAKISIDGKVLTEGRLIKVPATETVVKQLQLEQTNQGQLQFDSIAIVLASQYQYDSSGTWDVIADTVYISADFMPSSSAVNMALDKNVVNTITSDTLGITFNQFDRTYPGLKAFRIQTYAPGASDWLTLKEYVVDPKNLTVNNELLPNVPHVVYNYNMHGLADGNYRFRVLSVSSYGGDEVARSSNEILIAKDMVKPKPLGLPQPSNGILDIADDISVTFNEEIVKGALSNDGNFEITGVLNGSEIAHNTAFAMQGKELAAATEASFSLADKDFSTDMWLKATGEGTVLSHGNGTEKFKIALDRGMHLVLSVGNDTFTSSETVPQDSWCYLTVSYKRDGNGGLLNATVADEATAQTTDLFRDCVTEAYNGAGTLSVGENLKGAIHELTLWDVAHDNTEAQRQRQLTKMPSTAHLIGYWKMDEGDGTLINDYARNRHLVATGDTWYLNNVNKAVSLDGKAHLAFFAGDLAVGTEDNRAVELWVKAGKQQAEAQILQMGDIDVWTDKNGQIRLTASDNVQQTSTIDVADNQWHHIALNVLRSGNTSLYVDGQRALSLSSRNVGSLNSDSILVGVRRRVNPDQTYVYDRRLKAGIDEVRVWNATLDASTLADNRKLRLTGKETGLVAYFPFETKVLDSGNQLQTVPVDTCIVAMNMTRRMVDSSSGLVFSDVAPALKEKPVETNVPFSFTASNEKIVINIDEAPARIEGCTLNFRVKRVKDVNGNYCEPVCWSAYVHRNALSWMEGNVAMEQEVGQQSTFSAVIVNKGGTQQEWTISNLPQWLKTDVTSGMLSPLSQQTVCFTVAKSCPVGRYSETVYLVNSDDIAVPLTLELNVRGSVPTWTVDNGKYSSSMNLVGSLSIQGIPSNDPDDIVAAFVDGECRGVAHPVYNKRYDDYFVMLDIAGNADDKNRNVTFRVYDASTGTVWPMVKTSRDIDFNVSGVFGSFQEPVVLDALEMIEQTMTLGEGWNWMSLSVVANDMNATSLMSTISGSVDVVKSKKRSIMRYENLWDGGDILMNNREMYKVLMNNAEELSVIGLSPTDSERTITVRNGWNWLAYNGTAAISLGDAFASLNPVDGDLVKGKSGFAIFDGYEWAGTLQALVPSQGYMYLSKADADRSFSYPKSMAKAKAAAMEYLPVTMTVFNPVDDSKYPGNMTVVARVVYCGKPLAECETGVFAGSECRTTGITDSDGIVFLTIPGESVEKLTFRIKYGADILISDNTLEYSDDAVVGNRKSPFEIAFDERSITTSIVEVESSEADEKWYTYDGCALKQKPKATGVYIRVRNGKAEKIAVR